MKTTTKFWSMIIISYIIALSVSMAGAYVLLELFKVV